MSGGDLLSIQPTELKFPFELKKQSSCSMRLTNKTDQYVAFKVKTTNPKKYSVRPNTAVVLPGSTCDVTVTMQAQKEAPDDMQCKDKFLFQSVVAEHGATTKDINPEMQFNKEAGKAVEEFKLRVVYIPANPPSPVPEEPEEGLSPTSFDTEEATPSSSLSDTVTQSMEEPAEEKPSKVPSIISKLTEEKVRAVHQNQKLRQELEMLRNDSSKSQRGFSVMFVVLVGLLGALLGNLMKPSQVVKL
ncbi:hypothetical protein J5N97_001937 [Dioscorea zingiberensis]|uniref:MSP domain-containing protein n=1 Tax=Dioscorea zingiberensis TaxID=325984 RepID=A0A9D5H1R7_9LILI|nr:hypothetical protein J5N97_001937 [Dioscorea zingiberensis]